MKLALMLQDWFDNSDENIWSTVILVLEGRLAQEQDQTILMNIFVAEQDFYCIEVVLLSQYILLHENNFVITIFIT